MSKHTPGPWTTDNCNGEIVIKGGRADMYPLVAYCAYGDGTEEFANARLIAAAPDLLAALEQMLDADGDLYAMDFDMCRAAIRKAKGE